MYYDLSLPKFFVVLYLGVWFVVLSSKFNYFLIFHSYYYFNLNASVIFSGDTYSSFGISIDFSSVCETVCVCLSNTALVFFLQFCYHLNNHLILLGFFIYSFWSSFKSIYSRLCSMTKTFSTAFTTYVFGYILANIFTHIFSKRQKSITFNKFGSLGSIESVLPLKKYVSVLLLSSQISKIMLCPPDKFS